jgi:SAM-dependent methyltransferase
MKFVKRLERYVSAVFTLGRVKGMAKDAIRDVQFLQEKLQTQHAHLRNIDGRINQMSDWMRRHEALADDIMEDYRREAEVLKRAGQSDTVLLARMFTDLSRRLDNAEGEQSRPALDTPASIELPDTDGFGLFKDMFYHRLENQWRGAPEEIARRLRVYLADVEAAWIRTGEKPVMDIGCGRGEWLGLLREHNIVGFGIDTNAAQIEEAKESGLDLRLGDALQALASMEDNSLSVISAHHLIEHLPFDAVAWITREAGRVLAPGGLLLFETPNTRNVLVGATTFHTDPTHLKPMPEQVMGVLFETAGFYPVDTRHLNPHERFGEFLDTADFNDELAHLMFGPQDLAILGTKPKGV